MAGGPTPTSSGDGPTDARVSSRYRVWIRTIFAPLHPGSPQEKHFASDQGRERTGPRGEYRCSPRLRTATREAPLACDLASKSRAHCMDE